MLTREDYLILAKAASNYPKGYGNYYFAYTKIDNSSMAFAYIENSPKKAKQFG